ncbi:hypothetical protein HELRODRAFT_173731 [Helobdella robusta]|uniref:PDE8-like REC N-terminal domain-containing protein n=1 Tax=Helobdella robusta TaxID=6412 RepID=T1F762_HELRO|nr:hypothetical protein HELRODRAFT_173731 [Helobdella robusta]ESO03435.1 hypothetical protein HELRODRAFT_173731 [Helobdella robusta]
MGACVCHAEILLVFKSSSNPQCQSFVRSAEKLKYHCTAVSSVEQVIDKYRSTYFDVVIVDARQGSLIDPIECSKITDHDASRMMSMIKAGYTRHLHRRLSFIISISCELPYDVISLIFIIFITIIFFINNSIPIPPSP